jgi:lipopolysaccharide transport system ATP-binding protein
MNNIAIRVENLSKQYRIGGPQAEYQTIRETLTGALQAPVRRLASVARGRSSAEANETIWALKDVSFEVKQGEVLGIIGRNGAGKSTLLKILSRITVPTEGTVDLYGRVGSLLEVGTGFHPELTGRENVYLNGAILGMKKHEIERKFDEIVHFSGVEKFIDTPVKHYSSGMGVRLAFAVAAHLEPEILLVDEVLAVGDIGFQRKCLGKMEDISTGGRTVLFVSHNMAMTESLCPRAMLLLDGQKAIEGPAPTVIAKYMDKLRAHYSSNLRDRVDRKGTGEIRFTGVRILGVDGNHVEQVPSGQDCILSVAYETVDRASPSGVTFGAGFYSRGAHLFTVSTQFIGQIYDLLPPSGKVVCKIPRLPLAPGIYQFNLICRVRGGIADWITDAGELVVSEGDFFGTGQLPPRSHPGALVDHGWRVHAS